MKNLLLSTKIQDPRESTLTEKLPSNKRFSKTSSLQQIATKLKSSQFVCTRLYDFEVFHVLNNHHSIIDVKNKMDKKRTIIPILQLKTEKLKKSKYLANVTVIIVSGRVGIRVQVF